MKSMLKALAIGAVSLSLPVVASAATVNVSFTNVGTSGSSGVFRADLAAAGLTSVDSVKITDTSGGVGGASGIFSGFDLDAIFLDLDGDVNTAADRFFASSFDFLAGTTRPTGGNAALEPTAAHPGPTFGSLNSTTIDLATATLNVFDGISVADVNVADGFLTLGDGGSLTAFFNPEVLVGASLFLIAGEVGNNGESLSASVEVSGAVIPLPAGLPLLLTALGALGLVSRRRRIAA